MVIYGADRRAGIVRLYAAEPTATHAICNTFGGGAVFGGLG